MAMSEVSVKAMLDDLLLEIDIGALRYSQDFIQDLSKSFKQYGRLTEKQEASLRKIYRGHIGYEN